MSDAETDDVYRVHCSDCGYEVLVEGGAYRKSTGAKRSAKARRAGHISHGCTPDAVTIEPVDR